jgi:hypothetical protein
MSCKKCSNKLILSEYSVLHLNFLCVRCPHWISELSESFSKYSRFLARKLYVSPHSGLESAISIIYLFIIDDKFVYWTLSKYWFKRFNYNALSCVWSLPSMTSNLLPSHQLIVAQWLALLATNLKVSGSSLTGHPEFFKVSLVQCK